MKFRVNPVYKKELKISVRTARMSLIIFGYNLVLALIGLLAFYFAFNYGNYNISDYSEILKIYIFLAGIEFALVLFVVPAFTSNAISGEREKQTLEILLTTRLNPEKIIWGKLMSSISSTLLLVFSSLPILSIVFSVGGIQLLDLIALMAFCLVTAVFIGSIGIFFSTMFKRTVPSTIFTYGSIILLIAGTFAAVIVGTMVSEQAYSRQYYAAGLETAYQPPGVGNLILLLLINPAFSLVSLLGGQFCGTGYVTYLLQSVGSTHSFILSHWYGISIGLQMLISLILLKISAKKLNPL